jgi:hypothetical protein
MMCRSPPGIFLSSLTALGTSPVSSVEFGQDSGSAVCEATYFGALCRASLNGLSVVFQ